MTINKKNNKKIKVLFVIMFLVIFIPLSSIFQRNFIEEGYLKIVFLNVGQGTSIFVETPKKKQVIVDSGPNKEVLRRLGYLMNFWDRHIDLFIASHPDTDHIGGFPALVQNYDFDYFLKNENQSGTTYFKELIKRLGEKRVVNVKMGEKVYLEEDIYIVVLFPDIDTDEFESNTSSVVFKLVYEREAEDDFSMLFTGDAPAKIEKYLSELFPELLRSDILVVGHHGSKTSTDEEFLKLVNPDYSVITVGEGNSHGHPHADVLDRLAKWGGEIYRTDTMGDIKFLIGEDKVLVK